MTLYSNCWFILELSFFIFQFYVEQNAALKGVLKVLGNSIAFCPALYCCQMLVQDCGVSMSS